MTLKGNHCHICGRLMLNSILNGAATVHSLRHMYATILAEQGVPLIKISALLGHASVHTTFEYYCEVMDENDHILDFMNDLFLPEGGTMNAQSGATESLY